MMFDDNYKSFVHGILQKAKVHLDGEKLLRVIAYLLLPEYNGEVLK